MRSIFVIAALVLLAGCARQVPTPPSEFIVFFGAGSAEIGPDAKTVLDAAAAAIRDTHPPAVAVASGVAKGDNLRLAEPRYAAIQKGLMARGISEKLIIRSALPDAKLKVGASGDQRVEIMLLARPPG